VEETGRIETIEHREAGARLRIRTQHVLSDAREGSSIAVNGVCLTALDLQDGTFAADLAPETLRRTNLGDLQPGSRVNLERPMQLNARLDGHIVQGHVDGTGELLELKALGDGNWWLRIRVPEELLRFLVFKGSIAIDGISLTIAALEGDEIAITIIPHTYEVTSLSGYGPGSRVNIECDILAKHVERLMSLREWPAAAAKA
jgi:riboflavin synthase